MLTVNALSKTYPNGVRALRELSLSIGEGMFGLLGPNGAGKSTLMRTIAGIQEPDAGSIVIDGIDARSDKLRLKQMLGYLPQDFDVYPRVSCESLLDHLAILKGLVNKQERRASVEYLLHRLGLWDDRKRAVAGYSGGMRQRFGIAQALLGNPRLIIMDEPTAGLDPEQRSALLDLLAEVAEHAIVILSTHIVEDVTDLCTQMAIVAKGSVVFTGSPTAAVDALRGQVWRGSVEPQAQFAQSASDTHVLSARTIRGRQELRVCSPRVPGSDFAATEPDLKDVYFLSLKQVQDSVQPG